MRSASLRPPGPRKVGAAFAFCAFACLPSVFAAPPPTPAPDSAIPYGTALDVALRRSPDLAAVRAREGVARADVGVAGLLPNPALVAGTSTQAAKLSLGLSIPLLVFGQRAAAVDAARADLRTVVLETASSAVETRAAAAHAYVALWRAAGTAAQKERAAAIARRLEDVVMSRVQLGATAEVDGLRVRAERLNADAQAQQAARLVGAAGSDLGRYLGLVDGSGLRAGDAPAVPDPPPTLLELARKIDGSPAVLRERSDRVAAEARVARERALIRPGVTLDVGLDAWDPTLCPGPPCSNPPVNYRGTIAIDLPVLNQRGPSIEREQASAAAAGAREAAERGLLRSALGSAYRSFEAWSSTAQALTYAVVPAASAAAAAAEESYALGRAPLVAVLDAQKASIDAELSALDARAQQADAWIEVEHAAGLGAGSR